MLWFSWMTLVLQELLDWLQTESAMFSYCPTADVAAYQGILTIVYGKHLYFDGSGGSLVVCWRAGRSSSLPHSPSTLRFWRRAEHSERPLERVARWLTPWLTLTPRELPPLSCYKGSPLYKE